MSADPEVDRIRAVYSARQTKVDTTSGTPFARVLRAERLRRLQRLLREAGLHDRLPAMRILDVGCGVGNVLGYFEGWGARAENLCGIDLMERSVTTAREMHPYDFTLGEGHELPYPDDDFDLVLAFTLFSSILDTDYALQIATEMRRVLRPGASLLWYDLRWGNPRNPNVRGWSKAAIARLFPESDVVVRPITVAPPLSRRLGRATDRLYPLLASVPFVCSHYLGLVTPSPRRTNQTRS